MTTTLEQNRTQPAPAAQSPTLGYDPIRAYISERLKTVKEPEVRVELLSILTLCNCLEHQAQLIHAAIGGLA